MKNLIKRNYILFVIARKIRQTLNNSSLRGGVKISNKGCAKLTKNIQGAGHTIYIGKGTFIDNAQIYIRGNNNTIVFGDDCYIGPRCHFRCEGNGIQIIIGNQTTMTRDCNFTAQEDHTTITLGEDCMLSNTIVIRTSDSHPIYDEEGNRTNLAKSVTIGNHVWIAPQSTIVKGAIIGDNVIIGSKSLVTKNCESNSLYAGIPAKIIKKNVRWTREKLF